MIRLNLTNRHNYGIAIFDKEIKDVFDFNTIEKIAFERLKQETKNLLGTSTIEVVVTGLTSLTLAVVKAVDTINKNNNYQHITIKFLHYDRETGGYREQLLFE